eukprot:2830298-Pyramimonas_sp.AAC.1
MQEYDPDSGVLDASRICRLPAETLTGIAETLTSLRRLALSCGAMTDAAVDAIGSLLPLEDLEVDALGVGSKGLAPLAALTNLTSLDVARVGGKVHDR